MFSQSVGVNKSFFGDDGTGQPGQPGQPGQAGDQNGQPKIKQNISIVNNIMQAPKEDPPPYDDKKDLAPETIQPPKVKHYLTCSCLTLWLVNPLFGLIAFCLSYDSKHAAEKFETSRARRLGKAACAVNILGIIISLTVIIIILLWHYEVF